MHDLGERPQLALYVGHRSIDELGDTLSGVGLDLAAHLVAGAADREITQEGVGPRVPCGFVGLVQNRKWPLWMTR